MKRYFFIFLLLGIACLPIIIYVLRTRNHIDSLGLFPSASFEKGQQPVKTNSWFSSAYKFPSNNMFALPGAYSFSSEGMWFDIPTITAKEKLLSGGMSKWCRIHTASNVVSTKVQRYSDWTVGVSLSAEKDWTVSLTQGSPVIPISLPTQPLLITCQGGTFSTVNDGVLIVSGSKVALIQAQNGTLEKRSETEYALLSPTGKYRLSLLPDSEIRSLELFRKEPWYDSLQTHVSYKIDATSAITTYSFLSTPSQEVLTTIWPHQKTYLSGQPASLSTYQTVLGPLSLIKTKQFETRVPLSALPFSFARVSNTQRQAEIKKQIQDDTKEYLKAPIPGGVYFKGTWMGAIATLTQLADAYDLKTERDQLLALMQKELLTSFSFLHYDSTLNLLVSQNAEFGHEKGNDHHFHYGYYIRAASVVAQFHPELIEKFKPSVNDMIADIANTDRESARYPFLRTYSSYEGHSWADGQALFDDGNDQESTSEALNAWYAIHMWGDITKNATYKDLGNWLFSQELTGTKSYWFGVNNPFPADYDRSMASLVWGGKREFGTWFSGQPMHVYGIQWLPITPASGYLKGTEITTQLEALGKLDPHPLSHEWADLYLSVQSFVNPTVAQSTLPAVKTTAGTKLRSLLLQTVYKNAETAQQ